MIPQAHSDRVPKVMQEKYAAVVALTDAFCAKYLDEEYARLIRATVAALSRKRPSPLVSGTEKTWACGVTHAVGTVNFLFDSSQTPHVTSAVLYQGFDVAPSTGQAKSKAVRDTLGMYPMHPHWTLPRRIADNPLVWMVSVNGMIVDMRGMPRAIQEQAYAKGLIPYLPDEA